MSIVMTDRAYEEDPWQAIECIAYSADGEPAVSLGALLQCVREAVPEITSADLAMDGEVHESFKFYVLHHLLEIIEQKVRQ